MSASARTLAKSLVTLVREYPDQADRIVTDFVDFLKEHHLLGSTEVILRHLEVYRNEEARLGTLQITSTHEVTPALEKIIRTSLHVEDKTPVVSQQVEGNVSGVVAEYQGKVLDASMDTILNRLTQSLTESCL